MAISRTLTPSQHGCVKSIGAAPSQRLTVLRTATSTIARAKSSARITWPRKTSCRLPNQMVNDKGRYHSRNVMGQGLSYRRASTSSPTGSKGGNPGG
jgi:hypothetical protein